MKKKNKHKQNEKSGKKTATSREYCFFYLIWLIIALYKMCRPYKTNMSFICLLFLYGIVLNILLWLHSGFSFPKRCAFFRKIFRNFLHNIRSIRNFRIAVYCFRFASFHTYYIHQWIFLWCTLTFWFWGDEQFP